MPCRRPMYIGWRSGPSLARSSVSTIMLQDLAPRKSRFQSQTCPRTTSPSTRSSCGFARRGTTSTKTALSWALVAWRSLKSESPENPAPKDTPPPLFWVVPRFPLDRLYPCFPIFGPPPVPTGNWPVPQGARTDWCPRARSGEGS